MGGFGRISLPGQDPRQSPVPGLAGQPSALRGAPNTPLTKTVLEVVSQSVDPILTPDKLVDPKKCTVMTRGDYSIVVAFPEVGVYDGLGHKEGGCNTRVKLIDPMLFEKDLGGGNRRLSITSTSGNRSMVSAEVSVGNAKRPRDWTWGDIEDSGGDQGFRIGHSAGVMILEKNALQLRPPGSNEPMFQDSVGISELSDNFIWDSVAPKVGLLSYTPRKNPRKIKMVKADLNLNKLTESEVVLQTRYSALAHLSAVSGDDGFLYAETPIGTLVFIDSTTGEELARIAQFHHIHPDSAFDQIRGFDSTGRLLVCKIDVDELKTIRAAKEEAKRLQAVDLAALTGQVRSGAGKVVNGTMEAYLVAQQQQIHSGFLPHLGACTTVDAIVQLDSKVAAARIELLKSGVQPASVDFLLATTIADLLDRKKVVIGREMGAQLTAVEHALGGSITMDSVPSLRKSLAEIRTQEVFLSDYQQGSLQGCERRFEMLLKGLYGRARDQIQVDLTKVTGNIDASLTGLSSNPGGFNRWYTNQWPVLEARLRSMLSACPSEAAEAFILITNTITAVDERVEKARKEFDQAQDAVMQATLAHEAALINIIELDIARFLEALARQTFIDTAHGQAWVSNQQQYAMIMDSLAGLQLRNPQKAKVLDHQLRAEIAGVLDRKRRMERMVVGGDNQRYVTFGEENFPVWTHDVASTGNSPVNVSVVYKVESNQSGVKPADRTGTVMLSATSKNQRDRLVEMWKDSGPHGDGLRTGSGTYRGSLVPSSIMTASEFNKFKALLADWNLGQKSTLRAKEQEIRDRLHAMHAQRITGQKNGLLPVAPAWEAEYKKIYAELGSFCEANSIALLRHIDRVSAQLRVTKEVPSIGAVPRWASHWVLDSETENYLAKIARDATMQLTLQDGIVNLQGHAGTGKDVLIKMFCCLTERPYFSFDCSKWTTEYELSEDVQLVAEDGVTTTIKIPSTVLAAIQTPGAVLYFNELNAQLEAAMIFLHPLLDEKRTMTLKTSAGRPVKCLPSVVIASSMNPGYAGTTPLQFATKSRTIPIEVGYPELMHADGSYNSAEAWRVARGVESLFDLTVDGDSSDNAFVRTWEKEINNNKIIDAPVLTPIQKFDLSVIAALVQFGHSLRQDFIRLHDKKNRVGGGTKPLMITQPLTGREMRRCAYRLSRMSETAKLTASVDQTAKQLLTEIFLVHLDNETDREAVIQAMRQWTLKKKSN